MATESHLHMPPPVSFIICSTRKSPPSFSSYRPQIAAEFGLFSMWVDLDTRDRMSYSCACDSILKMERVYEN